jgi:hypothetical protein
MKKMIFIACLFIGPAVVAQIKAGSNKINKGVKITNTQPGGKINETNVLPPIASVSSFSQMKLKLPFSTVEKEYMVEKVGHFYVLNGDIIVGNDFPKTMAYSHDDKDYRWKNADIPFVVDPSIFEKGLNDEVAAAISEFNSKTTICMSRRTTQADYIKFVFSSTIKGAGLSPVGRQGGEQTLYLAASATKGTVVHELMHAMGFYHEQCREDRDQFVRIVEDNVKEGLKHNFQKETGVARSAYDYCSIMHYSTTAFSKNKLPTIECIQNGMVVACPPCLGNREALSDADIKGISWFYSNVSRYPCEAIAEPVYFPYKFPNTYPSASQAAMAAFRHRTDVAYKERHVSEFIKIVGAYPNMHEVQKGLNTVGGTVFLYSTAAQWQDVPLAELNNPSLDDFAARMRATQTYATANGFVGGFPTFYHADYGKGIVCGTVLIGSGGAEWRDVPIAELGNPALDDIRGRMTTANDYAFRNGFLGGFPTFYHADYGKGIVCGIVLIRRSAGEWRDVIVTQGPK